MITTTESGSIRLVSNPYGQRVGLVPLLVAVVFGWVFVLLWGAVSVFAFAYNSYWASVLAASTCAFGGFLAYMSAQMVRDGFREYVFELNDSEAILQINDKLLKKKTTCMILLNDVRFAEYYPYSDSSCVILHAPYYQMEMPLWPLGNRANDVIDFLIGRGIRMVDVQSDDPIPDYSTPTHQ